MKPTENTEFNIECKQAYSARPYGTSRLDRNQSIGKWGR